MVTWIKDDANSAYYDWALACLTNNPPCVELLCIIDDNNPLG